MVYLLKMGGFSMAMLNSQMVFSLFAVISSRSGSIFFFFPGVTSLQGE